MEEWKNIAKAYPVQSKWGSLVVLLRPLFEQYNQPSCSATEFALNIDDDTDLVWIALWELQDVLKQSCVLFTNDCKPTKQKKHMQANAWKNQISNFKV